MKTYTLPLLIGVIGALLLVMIGFLYDLTILFAFALAILSIGFSTSSLMVALVSDKRMTEIDDSLSRIVIMQEEIKKAQEEQASPSKPLLATLQGLSQYYLDYIAKQKGEDEKDQ